MKEVCFFLGSTPPTTSFDDTAFDDTGAKPTTDVHTTSEPTTSVDLDIASTVSVLDTSTAAHAAAKEASSTDTVQLVTSDTDDKSTRTNRRGLPMRRSAQSVAKRIAEITAWETASENSTSFQQLATSIEKEFAQEKRRKISLLSRKTLSTSEHNSDADKDELLHSDADEDELQDSDADESELLNSEPEDQSDSDADFEPLQQREPCTQSQSSSLESSAESAVDDDESSVMAVSTKSSQSEADTSF